MRTLAHPRPLEGAAPAAPLVKTSDASKQCGHVGTSALPAPSQALVGNAALAVVIRPPASAARGLPAGAG